LYIPFPKRYVFCVILAQPFSKRLLKVVIMATIRKRSLTDDNQEKSNRRRRVSANKGVNFYIPLNINIEEDKSTQIEEPLYSQTEVTALLAKQEEAFRQLLEEKLREQFNMFNQLYIDNIFKEYHSGDCSYIN